MHPRSFRHKKSAEKLHGNTRPQGRIGFMISAVPARYALKRAEYRNPW